MHGRPQTAKPITTSHHHQHPPARGRRLPLAAVLLLSCFHHQVIHLHAEPQLAPQRPQEAQPSPLEPIVTGGTPPEVKHDFVEASKAKILNMMGLKEAPRKQRAQTVVPRALLKEYLDTRETSREFIPDDKDFYGKLYIPGLGLKAKDYQSAGSLPDGFKVDMGSSDSQLRRNHSKRNAADICRHNRSTNSTPRSSGASSAASTPNQRHKPRAKPTRAGDKCSRRMLTVNFDEVGWSGWIIAPQAYNANYCHGDCTFPMSDQQNATNHAIIQSIFHSVGRGVPRSCCAPTKLGSIAILYQLDGVVQMRFYDDMIAEACGCL